MGNLETRKLSKRDSRSPSPEKLDLVRTQSNGVLDRHHPRDKDLEKMRSLDTNHEKQGDNQFDAKDSHNSKDSMLRDNLDKLDIINEKIAAMHDRYGSNFKFQQIDRDTQRDMPRTETMLEDINAPAGQRDRQRAEWKMKVRADKLIFNDGYATVPSLAGLDTKIKHRIGAKLQRELGSTAEQTLEVHQQEFRERDWDEWKIKDWSKQLDVRLEALESIENNRSPNYTSRYQLHELTHRLDSPQYYPTEELRLEAREAIRDIKQQLRNENGEDEKSQKRIVELYNRLPGREIEKWQKVLKKEIEYKDNPAQKKRSRVTTLEDLSREHLKQLDQGLKISKRVDNEARKLIDFLEDVHIKDVYKGTHTLTWEIKSNDIVRWAARKSAKNGDYFKAINKIPKELQGMVFQKVQEYQGQGIWQDMINQGMRKKGMSSESNSVLNNGPLAELLRQIPDEEMRLLIKVPDHRNDPKIIPLEAQRQYAMVFREIMRETGHERIFE